MPWIYNPTRDVHPVVLLDGSSYGFLPRKKVFIPQGNMSAEAWRLVQSRKLISHGGDPVVKPRRSAAPQPAPTKPVSAPVRAEKIDTSSSHHYMGDRVTVDSLNAFSGEKESKAVKKQEDDQEKLDPDKWDDDSRGRRGRSKRTQ